MTAMQWGFFIFEKIPDQANDWAYISNIRIKPDNH